MLEPHKVVDENQPGSSWQQLLQSNTTVVAPVVVNSNHQRQQVATYRYTENETYYQHRSSASAPGSTGSLSSTNKHIDKLGHVWQGQY